MPRALSKSAHNHHGGMVIAEVIQGRADLLQAHVAIIFKVFLNIEVVIHRPFLEVTWAEREVEEGRGTVTNIYSMTLCAIPEGHTKVNYFNWRTNMCEGSVNSNEASLMNRGKWNQHLEEFQQTVTF